MKTEELSAVSGQRSAAARTPHDIIMAILAAAPDGGLRLTELLQSRPAGENKLSREDAVNALRSAMSDGDVLQQHCGGTVFRFRLKDRRAWAEPELCWTGVPPVHSAMPTGETPGQLEATAESLPTEAVPA